MKQKLLAYYSSCLLAIFCYNQASAQIVLEANGPGNTYELINSVLAPGYTAVEAPEQCGNHAAFGRHIAEVFDATLNQNVFEFYSHVNEDNDRCISFDRQRVEIKTYESSPANLKATIGETVTYKWKFRLPSGFQPSANFTHIHQIKAVGGDDDDPIFILTPRAGTTNTLQLIYVDATSSNNTNLATVNLSLFLGTWVEVTEQIKFGANGTYSIAINRISDGAILLSYSNNNILTFRADNSFVRPKWGIYRSLNSASQLRDDSIRFASFSIYEGTIPFAPSNLQALAVSASQINLQWTDNSNNETTFVVEESLNGTSGWSVINTSLANSTSFSRNGLNPNTTYYYRIKSTNPAGNSIYTSVVNATTQSALPVTILSFNAVQQNEQVKLIWKVAQEVNVKKYEVEYSTDGILFSTIGIIEASKKYEYSFIKNSLKSGKYFFRIKVVDVDNSYEISPTIRIEFKSKATINIYPNPAKSFVRVELEETPSDDTFIILIDAVGKTLNKVKVLKKSFELPINQLVKGFYHVQLFSKGEQIGEKTLLVSY